jgi:hypothetical protein
MLALTALIAWLKFWHLSCIVTTAKNLSVGKLQAVSLLLVVGWSPAQEMSWKGDHFNTACCNWQTVEGERAHPSNYWVTGMRSRICIKGSRREQPRLQLILPSQLVFAAALQCNLEQEKRPYPHQDAVALRLATIDPIIPGLLQDKKHDLW